MRILLINHYAGSDTHGMEFRPYYMAREWVKLGHEVTVVAASYSHLRKVNPEVSENFTEEKLDGITYLWIKTPPYQGNGLSRAKNMAAFYYRLRGRLRRLASDYKPEAVIASSTYPFDFYLARRLARLSGGRCYFEIHDLWPLTQIELYGMSESNLYVKMLQKAEDTAFKNSYKVISILSDAYKHMEERGVSKDKFVYVPNGVYLNKEKPPGQHAEYVKGLRREGRFVVMYLGGFALANALEELVKTAALVDDSVKVVLVGDGNKKQELMELNKNLGGKAEFLGSVPKDEVIGLLRLADCLYLGSKRSSLYRYGVGMNKLYDYMLAAKPIIWGIEAPPGDPVTESGCGRMIRPQDENAIREAVESIRQLPEDDRTEMGRKGREYVIENYEYPVLAKKFADSLKE